MTNVSVFRIPIPIFKHNKTPRFRGASFFFFKSLVLDVPAVQALRSPAALAEEEGGQRALPSLF